MDAINKGGVQMNILIVMSELPFPFHKNGISNTIGNLIENWNTTHRITILYFSERTVEVEEKLKEIYSIDIIYSDLKGREYFYKTHGIPGLKTRNSWGYKFNHFVNIDFVKFDRIILSSFVPAYMLNSVDLISSKDKIIFFEADAISLYYKRSAMEERSLIRKAYFLTQSYISRKMELRFIQRSGKVIYVSDVDKKYIERILGRGSDVKRLQCLNIGVHSSAVRSIDFKSVKEHVHLCFSGIMSYTPNIMAVDYILETLVPELEKKGIPFTFHIVGKEPQERWFKNQYVLSKKVVLTGFLEDIDGYLAQMDIYVSPLFLGTGMKNKILQAMVIGLPIVCSTVSKEGINQLEDGINYIECNNDPELWSKHIYELINDTTKMSTFSKEVRNIAINHYTWQSIARDFLEMHEDKSDE